MAAYLVIGGAGRTGSRVVTRLRALGHEALVVSRHPGHDGMRLDLSTADPGDALFDGVDGCVVSVEPPTEPAGAEKLLHRGVATVAAATAQRGSRLVVVSQIYVTRPDAYPAMADITNARGRGEQAVRDTGADYAIVRPGWLHDGRAAGSRLEQGDRGDGRTSRDSVADVCVHLLTGPHAGRVTFEIFDDPAAGDVASALTRLRADVDFSDA